MREKIFNLKTAFVFLLLIFVYALLSSSERFELGVVFEFLCYFLFIVFIHFMPKIQEKDYSEKYKIKSNRDEKYYIRSLKTIGFFIVFSFTIALICTLYTVYLAFFVKPFPYIMIIFTYISFYIWHMYLEKRKIAQNKLSLLKLK